MTVEFCRTALLWPLSTQIPADVLELRHLVDFPVLAGIVLPIHVGLARLGILHATKMFDYVLRDTEHLLFVACIVLVGYLGDDCLGRMVFEEFHEPLHHAHQLEMPLIQFVPLIVPFARSASVTTFMSSRACVCARGNAAYPMIAKTIATRRIVTLRKPHCVLTM